MITTRLALATTLILIGIGGLHAQTTNAAPVAPMTATVTPGTLTVDAELVPWGITTSASSTRTCAEWLPKMATAGIRWARMFPEWSSLENPKGTFNFTSSDALVNAAEANHIEMSGLFFGAAKFADPHFHAFPMKNLDDWSDYAAKLTDRYKGRIHYWEVWNEGNAGFNDNHNVTADYANLVAYAYAGAKKSDPTALVGMSVASFDPAYIDQAILDQAAAGKAGSFDYLCIHPYETFGLIGDVDGEVPYLWMTRLLRDELKADAPPDKANVPIWITEIGRPLDRATNEVGIPLGQNVHEIDAAKAVVKSYVMAAAQGIARICWFEARDPVGEPPGYGLLKGDNSPRISYLALQAMTGALGETPKYQGWLALGAGQRSYGFVFLKAATYPTSFEKPPLANQTSSVLALWMPAGLTDNTIIFSGDVQVIDALTNTSTPLKAGQTLALTDKPVFVTGLPVDLVAQAQANASKPFPWGGDYSKATSVSLQLGPDPVSSGVVLQGGNKAPHTFPDGSTGLEVEGKIGTGANFYTHPSFAGIKTKEYYIRMSFRRITAGNVGMNFSYEVADSQGKGPLRHSGGWYSVGPDMGWQTQTWHVTDACFAKMWGFDFCIQPEQSVPFVVGKVEVSTQPFGN